MPTNKRSILDISQEEYKRLQAFAESLAQSNMTAYYRNGKNGPTLTAFDLFSKMLKGMELGMEPMAALDALYYERGKWAMHAQDMLGLVSASGLLEDMKVVQNDGEACIIKVKRAGYSEYTTFEFTLSEAREAEILKNDKTGNWKKRPAVMLWHRCTSKMCRGLFNDVVQGTYVIGELSDSDGGNPDEIATTPEPPRRENGSDKALNLNTDKPKEKAKKAETKPEAKPEVSDEEKEADVIEKRKVKLAEIRESLGWDKSKLAAMLKEHGFKNLRVDFRDRFLEIVAKVHEVGLRDWLKNEHPEFFVAKGDELTALLESGGFKPEDYEGKFDVIKAFLTNHVNQEKKNAEIDAKLDATASDLDLDDDNGGGDLSLDDFLDDDVFFEDDEENALAFESKRK